MASNEVLNADGEVVCVLEPGDVHVMAPGEYLDEEKVDEIDEGVDEPSAFADADPLVLAVEANTIVASAESDLTLLPPPPAAPPAE